MGSMPSVDELDQTGPSDGTSHPMTPFSPEVRRLLADFRLDDLAGC